MLSAGILLFVVGQIGNLYHHWLLATMRRPAAAASTSADRAAGGSAPAQEKAYVIPRGGLFELVTMPHYFFEILAWIGIALSTQQLNAFLAAAGMASYLSGRAVATSRWYQSKFGNDWPVQRRHLVPFIF